MYAAVWHPAAFAMRPAVSVPRASSVSVPQEQRVVAAARLLVAALMMRPQVGLRCIIFMKPYA